MVREVVKKSKKLTLKKYLKRDFEKKQLFFKIDDDDEVYSPTPEFVVVDKVNNSIVRPCKESYSITHNEEILEGVSDAANELGYSVVDMAPFKTNEGMFVIIDTGIEVPTLVSHLVKNVKVFVIEGNSEDISLSSGVIFTLIDGFEVMYHNAEMKSGTRSSKSFANRKYIIPEIIQRAVDISDDLLHNLKRTLKINANESFVEDHYRTSKDGKPIKGDNGKFESNIIDIHDSTELFINKYSDKSLAGYIIGYMSAITQRFLDEDNINERYTQMFATQSSINKKVIPIFEKYLYVK